MTTQKMNKIITAFLGSTMYKKIKKFLYEIMITM